MSIDGLSIVDTDAFFAARLAAYLDSHGLPADLMPDLSALLDSLPRRPTRMVVLGEARGGALPALRRLRDVSRVPCVVLSAGPDEVNHIGSLEAGADDFIDRELPMRTILARIRAVLRRAEWPPETAAPAVEARGASGWRLLTNHRRLLRPDGSECDLTTAEFDLLRLLAEANGVPVSREDISATVFRRRFRAEDRTVDNLVLRLRRKLGPEQDRAIKTVRGAGYMFAGFIDADMLVA
jgi:DNA-binding response OmpR family regulator